MTNRSKRNTVLDIILFLLMLAVFSITGEYHKPLAITFGVLLILHTVWHWQQFKIMYRQLIPDRTYRYLVNALIAILITAVVTLPLYAPYLAVA